jgi:hypothetical protein
VFVSWPSKSVHGPAWFVDYFDWMEFTVTEVDVVFSWARKSNGHSGIFNANHSMAGDSLRKLNFSRTRRKNVQQSVQRFVQQRPLLDMQVIRLQKSKGTTLSGRAHGSPRNLTVCRGLDCAAWRDECAIAFIIRHAVFGKIRAFSRERGTLRMLHSRIAS